LPEFKINEEGGTMRNSEILMVLTVMVISNSAHATLATCPACRGGQPDWVASATAFLEGKPTNNTPSTLNGPQQARLLDAQIDSRKKAGQASSAASNTAATLTHNSTPMFDIGLKNIHAVPNPANFDDMVKIIAVFENISYNLTAPDNPSKMTDLIGMMVCADIKNSAGLEVGRVNLKRSSGNEYAGIWDARVGSDAYNATIEISGPGGSKTFNDALQIIVGASENTTGNIHVIRKIK
jgi:hypothetical protein